MKIGISGTSSVGKTSLLNALRSEQQFKHYTIANEVTRKLAAQGFKINEAGNDATQYAIMNSHIVNLFMNDDMLTDRTALDGLVYTKWLYIRGQVEAETLDYAFKVFDRAYNHYDVNFFISPEFEIEDDGVRSNSVSFRDEIHDIFEQYIKEYNLPVIRLTGSVRERVEQVIQHIKEIS